MRVKVLKPSPDFDMFEGSDFKTYIKFQPSYPKEKELSILESEVFRTTDVIFTQLSVIEYNKELNILFVDQEKQFDRVNREILWKVLGTTSNASSLTT